MTNNLFVKNAAVHSRDAAEHDQQRFARAAGLGDAFGQVVVNPMPGCLDLLGVIQHALPPIFRGSEHCRGQANRRGEDDGEFVHELRLRTFPQTDSSPEWADLEIGAPDARFIVRALKSVGAFHELAVPERGSVTRSTWGCSDALRLTEPRSHRVVRLMVPMHARSEKGLSP